MPRLTRIPTAKPAKPPAPLDPPDPHPWDESFGRLEQLTEHWKLVVGIVLPAYALMRILAFTGVKRTGLLEVVRRQGVSGIAEAVVTSLVTELGGLILVSMLVFLVWWFFKASWEQHREWRPFVLVGAFPFLLLIFILPWTMVLVLGVFVAVWLGFIWKREWEPVASVLLIAVAVIAIFAKPFFSAPWLPLEALSWKDGTTGPTTGYVLGEGEGFLSFLQDGNRNILLIRSDALAGRMLCRDPKKLDFDAPSIVELGRGKTPDCPRRVPPQGVPPTLPGTTVTTARTVTTTSVDPATTSTTGTTVDPATTSTTGTTVGPATTSTTGTIVGPQPTLLPITRTG
jgi:hypothetical protein